jgi:hypothetical protein
MRNFIKITSRVINKRYIVEIIKREGRYSIYIDNRSKKDKFILSKENMGRGENIIEVNDIDNKEDYDNITNEFFRKK